jgi:hypothetical protein
LYYYMYDYVLTYLSELVLFILGSSMIINVRRLYE